MWWNLCGDPGRHVDDAAARDLGRLLTTVIEARPLTTKYISSWACGCCGSCCARVQRVQADGHVPLAQEPQVGASLAARSASSSSSRNAFIALLRLGRSASCPPSVTWRSGSATIRP